MLRRTIFFSLVLVAGGSARTIQVPGDFATIQEAIQSAQDGDQVSVRAGTLNPNNRIPISNLILATLDPNI